MAEQYSDYRFDSGELTYECVGMEVISEVIMLVVRVVHVVGDRRLAPVAGSKLTDGSYAPPRNIGAPDDLNGGWIFALNTNHDIHFSARFCG